ncbi:(deoxy)nucleoside triphosphate pyrophosphohydrolase [uncultured Algoriphagus sp.]|uniref:(deoxy)nucleoside triphosphate pyrophosphohydrolase n=1 Tax=uncultured Algoriphagus sp. TaxID=417365 RepID=UPI00258A628D|nr:(deoxy)nucleoside triphosphate pyrophosphohydrolase [uncultured Algoriphagus sp.]
MTIPVACAVILADQKVLAVRRSKDMPLSGYWEFPGGKVEEGESPESCIVREIAEELGIRIRVLASLPNNTHAMTSGKSILLIPFLAAVEAGEIKLYEHDQLSWLGQSELFEVNWAPADITVVKYLEENWDDMLVQFSK